MKSEIAIEVNQVSKCYQIYSKPADRLKQTLLRGHKTFYKEFWALKNISLTLKKGESFGIVGRNGSGKSTLLQIIAGTLMPTSGSISVTGRVAALLELGSGFNPDFTGKENVYMNATILGLNKKEIDALYDEIIAFADIGDFIDQPVSTYSSGMAVRLAFAVQAVIPKEVLIVDEALAVGDELFQRKCFAKIEDFKKQGGTILFVSHSGGAVIELCDRALLLDSGEEVIIGPSKQVVNLYQKLLYAPTEKKGAVRKEIYELAKSKKENHATSVQTDVGSEIHDNVESMYDPYLIPKETIRYEPAGAEILNASITALKGEKVNLLLPGEQYIFTYSVKFSKTSYNVRFAMLIKTSSGFDLGGAVSSKLGEGIPVILEGETVNIQFKLTPKLNAGIYFLNAGVLGMVAEEEIFLDRKIDISAFKIISNGNPMSTAIIDFNIEANILSNHGRITS